MKLQNSTKNYKNYKVCHPDETIERIINGFNKLNLKVNNEEEKYGSIYVNKTSLSNDVLITAGKGMSAPLSRASSYAELAERFSCGLMSDYETNVLNLQAKKSEKYLFKPFSEVSGNTVELKYFFDSFSKDYSSNPGIVELIKHFPFVWEEAWSLTKNHTVLYPFYWQFYKQASTGFAAGNSPEEAIMQASCEIVERYVTSKIILEKINLPTINPESIKSAEIIEIMDWFKMQNIDFVIKDCSLNLPLCTLGVLFIENDCEVNNNFISTRNKLFMLGTATDAETALMRCFTEYVQCNLNAYESLEKFWKKYSSIGFKYEPSTDRTILSHLYKIETWDVSFLKESTELIDLDKMPNYFQYDFKYEIENLVDSLSKAGIELLVNDLTHPVLDFPVVQVIIPQLQTFDLEPDITKVISKIADSHQIIFSDDSLNKIIYNSLGYKPEKSIVNYLLLEDWYKSSQGIENTIQLLENKIKEEPAEFIYFLGTNIYTMLSYLLINIGDYDRAHSYSKLIPEVVALSLNKNKRISILVDYVRIQLFLESSGIPMDGLAKGLKKLLSSSGTSLEFEKKWNKLGTNQSNNIFALCNFKCQQCEITDNNCIWRSILIDDFILKNPQQN